MSPGTHDTATGARIAPAATATRTPGTVVELGHIVLYVADLERSLAFYRDLLGWRVQASPEHFPAAAFRAGPTHHDLLLIEVGPDAQRQPAGRRLGLYHFGVKVGDHDDDLRAVRDRVLAHPELTRLVGATDHGMTHSLYVLDPDGNEIELYIDVAGVDWDDPTLFTRRPAPLVL